MLLILIGCNLHGIKPDLKLGWAPNHFQNCIRGSINQENYLKKKKLKPKVLSRSRIKQQ